MWSYALKRCLMSIPTLFLVAVIVFFLIRFIPGDPAVLMLSDMADDDMLQRMRQRLGLDKPVLVQFGIWLGNVLTGDLGTSIRTGEDVLEAVLGRFRVTASVVILSVGLAALIAAPAGLIAAHRQNTRVDFFIILASIISLSLPSFWVGMMLLLLFGLTLGWLPTIGFVTLGEDLGRGLIYLIMPVIALALTDIGGLTRMMRSSALDVLRLEYVTHARAKGLSEGQILWGHVFKNAAGAPLTMLGLALASLLGGAAVTETVFSLPGIGKLIADAIYARDYPVLQGALLLIAAVYVVVNLAVDLLYAVIDPRVRLT